MTQINSSTILLAFVAILFGLAGTYTLRHYLRQPQPVAQVAPAPVPPKRITVPLASRDISPGTEITLDDVALYRMTREQVNEKLNGQSFMTNPDQIVGKVAMISIERGTPFHTQDFYPVGTRPGIADRIPAGNRAITILLEPTSALLGFAGPGQKVDVLFHYGQNSEFEFEGQRRATAARPGDGFFPGHHVFNPPRFRDYDGNTASGNRNSRHNVESSLQNATVTLVQDATIMALGNKATPTGTASGLASDEKVAVTLAVLPRDAEMLRVASGHGELSLTMRGPSDDRKVELLNPVTLAEIIKVDKKVHEMVIHRGKSVSRLKFASGREVQRKVFGATAEAEQAQRHQNTNPYSSPLPPTINIVTPYPYAPVQPVVQGSSTRRTIPKTEPILRPATVESAGQ